VSDDDEAPPAAKRAAPAAGAGRAKRPKPAAASRYVESDDEVEDDEVEDEYHDPKAPRGRSEASRGSTFSRRRAR
jgi:hypothetical protein